MKHKILYSLLLLAGCFMLPACTDSDDENGGNDTPPAGALPSKEFTLNTLPDEPYAEDAIRIEAQGYDTPFLTLELMGDGYYLLTKNPDANLSYASETRQAKGKGALHKSRTTIRTRGTWDENGTLTTPDGLEYGRYTKLGANKYRLSDGIEIALQNATGSNGSVVYKGFDGRVSTVPVNVSEPIITAATKSLCRSWEDNSLEMWVYWNGIYIAHGKQVLNNGKADSYFKAIGEDLLGLSREDFMDDDDECCYKTVFSKVGTYLCFYLDGEIQRSYWNWDNEEQGMLHWYDEYDDGHCTVRFAGNQMRVYEDYTEGGDGEELRAVAVSTLTAME